MFFWNCTFHINKISKWKHIPCKNWNIFFSYKKACAYYWTNICYLEVYVGFLCPFLVTLEGLHVIKNGFWGSQGTQ